MANILLSDIVTRVTTLLGSDAQLSSAEVQSMAIARYEILHDANPWSKRRKEFTINLVALTESDTSNTITATVGSSNVQISQSGVTAFLSTHDNTQIRIGSQRQYYFVSYNTNKELGLEDGNGNTVNWPAETVTGNSWRIFQTRYSLPTDCDVLISIGYDYPLEEMDGGRYRLDEIDPHRESVASDVRFWAYAGVSGTTRQIEVWPVPTTARTLRGQYLTEAAQISSTSTISNVHPAVLTWAVAADCYGMLFSKTGDQSYQHLQMFYEKKATEALNDILPHEVSRNNPPTTIWRRNQRGLGGIGKYNDWDTNHDTGLGW